MKSKNKLFIIKIMDFDVEIFKLPDHNSTAIKITANNGKTNSTVIKNRDFEADTQSLVSQTVFKLVCATVKELVKEKWKKKVNNYLKELEDQVVKIKTIYYE